MKAAKSLRFGLSLGWRAFLGRTERFETAATINPADTTVVVDKTDQSDVVLSGVAVAYPFGTDSAKSRTAGQCGWCALGFVANVTVASLTEGNIQSFNQTVEGGIGLDLALATDFAIGVTVERAFRRRLRDFVKPGAKLMDENGAVVTTLSPTDERFFVQDNVTAVSLKFIYFF